MPPITKQPFLSPLGTPLAIDPKAYGEEFICLELASAAPISDQHQSIVHVDGPISYASSLFWASYDSIRSQVQAACKLPAPVVTLRVNSPGGDVHGAFDCARDLRRICEAAGKRLIVHVEAQCCSAGYALASQAHEIAVSSTACVGSIGVIAQYVTAVDAAAKEGLKHTTISSGAYKADGNPMAPIDDPMRARLQAHVDGAALEFFELVSTGRRMSVDSVRALQAGSFLGHESVKAGLADAVMSWSEFCDRLSTDGTIQPTQANASATSGADSMSDREDIRSRLTKQAESDDPVEAKRAKKALASYDESEGDDDADDKGKASDDDKPDPKAADEKPDPKAADDKPDPKAADDKPEQKALSALVSKVQALEAKAAADSAKLEATERSALYASRPDISDDLRKTLNGLPVASAKAVLAGVPVAGRAIHSSANLPEMTRGRTGGPDLSTPEARAAVAATLPPEIQAGIGLKRFTPGQTFEVGNKLYFGQPPHVEES